MMLRGAGVLLAVLVLRVGAAAAQSGKAGEKDEYQTVVTASRSEEEILESSRSVEVIEKEGARPRVKRTDRTKTYEVPYFADFVPTEKISLPFGYLIPIHDPEILDKLLLHGITVEKLTEPITLEVESFRLKEVKASERLYQGHYMNSASGEFFSEEREFSAGTLFVGMAQPLANLAAYLLEAQSDDGFLVWNILDRYLASQWGRGLLVYPVHRLLKPVMLVKEIVR